MSPRAKIFSAVVTALVVLIAPVAPGQTYLYNFHKRFDTQTAIADSRALIRTADGGYAYCGYLSLPADGNAIRPMLVKLNATYQLVWATSYIAPGAPIPTYIYAENLWQTSDGGYILCGRHAQAEDFQGVFLLKVDAVGAVQWHKIYVGIDNLLSVIEMMSAGLGPVYMVCGHMRPDPSSGPHSAGLVMAVDLGGTFQWLVQVWGPEDNYAGGAFYRQIIPYDDHSAAVVGAGNIELHANGSDLKDSDVLVTRIDTFGTIQFNSLYGVDTTTDTDGRVYGVAERGYSISGVYSGGDLVISGNASTVCFTECYPDLFGDVLVLRLAANGAVAWANRYDVRGSDDAGVRVVTRGVIPRVYVAGTARTDYFPNPLFNNDMFLLEANGNGSVASFEVYGDMQEDRAVSLVGTGPGYLFNSFAILGNTRSYNTSNFESYLVERFNSKVLRCHDRRVPITVTPVPLPPDQPLVAYVEQDQFDVPLFAVNLPAVEQIVCQKILAKPPLQNIARP